MNRAVLDAAMRRSLMLFLKRCFAELHPGDPPIVAAWYLKALCHALEEASSRPGSRLAIGVPPRHGKSIAASVALSAWLLGRDPTTRIMVATHSQELARLHAQQCRQLMQTDWYKRLFPNTRIADDGNRLLEITTTMGGGRRAVSVGGSVTGFGADLSIVDDCLKADDARSEARREELLAWYDGSLVTRLNHIDRSCIISISQRLHERDLFAHLIDKGFEQLLLPAIAEKEEQVPIGGGLFHHRVVGSLLDRPGHSREALDRLRRELGPQVFSAQYQQNPVAPEGNLIRMEWFGAYELDDTEWPNERRARYQLVIQSWDTASSEEPTADWSVGTTWGWRDGRWDLVDVLRQRLAFPDLRKAVLRLHRRWQADAVVIEDAGAGKSLWQEFRAGRELRPIMWRPALSKEERLIGVTGQLAAGICRLPVEAPWLETFRAELRGFPFGRHDDQVDSLSQFLEYTLQHAGRLPGRRDGRGPPRPRRPSGRRGR